MNFSFKKGKYQFLPFYYNIDKMFSFFKFIVFVFTKRRTGKRRGGE